MTVAGAASTGAGDWQATLAELLRDADVEVLDAGAAGAVPVDIVVTTESGDGTTPAGTRFTAVRFTAVVRVHRAQVTVRGAPFTAPTDPDLEAAREDLLARLIPLLAY